MRSGAAVPPERGPEGRLAIGRMWSYRRDHEVTKGHTCGTLQGGVPRASRPAKGRIELDRPVLEWLQTALQEPRVELLPLTPAIAVQATRLGAGFPGDPADGIIVATALVEAAPLVTKDQKILDFTGVETIWD